MLEVVCYLVLAFQVVVWTRVYRYSKNSYKGKEEFYDRAFEAYQREYLCKGEKDIQREIRRFRDCKHLVYNELKNK